MEINVSKCSLKFQKKKTKDRFGIEAERKVDKLKEHMSRIFMTNENPIDKNYISNLILNTTYTRHTHKSKYMSISIYNHLIAHRKDMTN